MWQNWKPNFPSYSFELTAGDQSSTAYTILKTIFRCQEIVLEKYNTSSSFDAKIKWNGSQLTLLNARVQLKYPENTYKMIKFKNSSGDEVRVSMTAMEIYDGHNNKLDIGDRVFGGSYAVAWGELGSKKNEIILTKPIKNNNEITFNYIAELGLEDDLIPSDLYKVKNNSYFNFIVGEKESKSIEEKRTNRNIQYQEMVSDVNSHNFGFGYIPGYKVTNNNSLYNLSAWIDATKKSDNIEEYFWNSNLSYSGFSSSDDKDSQVYKFNSLENIFPIVAYDSFSSIVVSNGDIPLLNAKWEDDKLKVNNKIYSIDSSDKVILCYRPAVKFPDIFEKSTITNTKNYLTWNYADYGYTINLEANVKFNAEESISCWESDIQFYDITQDIKTKTIPSLFPFDSEWTNPEGFSTVENQKTINYLDSLFMINSFLLPIEIDSSVKELQEEKSDYFFDSGQQKTTTTSRFNTSFSCNSVSIRFYGLYRTIKYSYQNDTPKRENLSISPSMKTSNSYSVSTRSSTVDRYLATATNANTIGWRYQFTNFLGTPFLAAAYTHTDNDTWMSNDGSGLGIAHTIRQQSTLYWQIMVPTPKTKQGSVAIIILKNGKSLENS